MIDKKDPITVNNRQEKEECTYICTYEIFKTERRKKLSIVECR